MRDLLEVLLKVTLLSGVGLAAAAMLRSGSAAVRHWVLVSAIASAMLVPVFHLVVPAWLPQGAVLRVQTPGPLAVAGTGEIELKIGPPATDSSLAAVSPEPATVARSRVLTIALAIWACGAAVSGAAVIVGLVRLRRLERRARPLTAGPWVDLLEPLSRDSGVRPPALLVSTQSTLLATWGFRRPRILLPQDAASWSPSRVRLVLAHELAHVQRGDWIALMLAEAARCVYWFNPLVWIAWRRLRLESERACDDVVLGGGVNGADYAAELVDLARTLNARRPMWVPAPAMARPSNLEGRVTAMLNPDTNRRPVSQRTRALVLVTLAALTVPLAGAVLLAQTYSSFTGATRDEFRTPMSGVTLTLANIVSGQKYEVKSNAVGAFEFVGLPNGEYELQAALPGFRNVTSSVQIVGRNLQRDIDMRVGSLQETISVRASSSGAASAAGSPPVHRGVAPAKPECVASPISGRILPPRKISDARPRYPEGLRQSGIGGVVVLDALIATDGTVKEATGSDPSAHPELVAAAIDAVKLWEYTPTLLNCMAVEVSMKVTVSFSTEQ